MHGKIAIAAHQYVLVVLNRKVDLWYYRPWTSFAKIVNERRAYREPRSGEMLMIVGMAKKELDARLSKKSAKPSIVILCSIGALAKKRPGETHRIVRTEKAGSLGNIKTIESSRGLAPAGVPGVKGSKPDTALESAFPLFSNSSRQPHFVLCMQQFGEGASTTIVNCFQSNKGFVHLTKRMDRIVVAACKYKRLLDAKQAYGSSTTILARIATEFQKFPGKSSAKKLRSITTACSSEPTLSLISFASCELVCFPIIKILPSFNSYTAGQLKGPQRKGRGVLLDLISESGESSSDLLLMVPPGSSPTASTFSQNC